MKADINFKSINLKDNAEKNFGSSTKINIDCRGYKSEQLASNRENLLSESKSNFVTDVKSGVSNSPYKFQVTGKWTVSPVKRERPFGIGLISFWLCFLIAVIITNMLFFQILISRSDICSRMDDLESAVDLLERKTLHLESTIADLKQRCSSSHESISSSDSSTGTLIRWKRSNDDDSNRRENRIESKETVAVQLLGSKPNGYTLIPPQGILGPWIESSNDYNNVLKFGARLHDDNHTLEISRSGVYSIYAQVTYQSVNVANSFSIYVIPNKDRVTPVPITTCSFGRTAKDGETSCYTSVVKRLNAGDLVFVQLAQMNREVVFTRTCTYFGLIFLMA